MGNDRSVQTGGAVSGAASDGAAICLRQHFPGCLAARRLAPAGSGACASRVKGAFPCSRPCSGVKTPEARGTAGESSTALTKPPRPRILRGYFLPPGAASGANSPICRKRQSRNRTKRNPGTVESPPPLTVPRPRPGRSPGIPGCANLAPPTKKPPRNRPRTPRPKPPRRRAPSPLQPRLRPTRRERNRLPPPRLRRRLRARRPPRRLPRPVPTRKCTPSPGWT